MADVIMGSNPIHVIMCNVLRGRPDMTVVVKCHKCDNMYKILIVYHKRTLQSSEIMTQKTAKWFT